MCHYFYLSRNIGTLSISSLTAINRNLGCLFKNFKKNIHGLINLSITLDEEFSKHWDQIGFPFPLKVLPIFKVPHIHIASFLHEEPTFN